MRHIKKRQRAMMRHQERMKSDPGYAARMAEKERIKKDWVEYAQQQIQRRKQLSQDLDTAIAIIGMLNITSQDIQEYEVV